MNHLMLQLQENRKDAVPEQDLLEIQMLQNKLDFLKTKAGLPVQEPALIL